MKHQSSILLVTRDEALSDALRGSLPTGTGGNFTTENASLAGLNGHAVDLVKDHDVVIFDANPDDDVEMAGIAAVMDAHKSGTVFLALTDNDVTITKARRLRDMGVEEVLPRSMDEGELSALIEDLVKRRNEAHNATNAGDARSGCVIPVMQARGGLGATTVAVNLACALVGKSGVFRKNSTKRVALLDFDLQFGNAQVYLDLEDNGGFLDLIESRDVPDANFLRGTLQHHPSGIDILGAPGPIGPLQALRPDLIAGILTILQRDYDFVVVDLPRALVDWVDPVLAAASMLVMVTDTSVPCIRQARRLMDFVKEDHIALPTHLVVNRATRPLIKSEHCREAEKVLEHPFESWIPENLKLARSAVDLGQPVTVSKPRSDMSKAIRKMAKTIEEKQSAPKTAAA